MKHYFSIVLTLAASALLLASCAKNLSGNGNENYLSFSSNIAEIVQVKSGAGVQADTDSPARFVMLSSADGSKSLQMELSVEPNTAGLGGDDYAGTKAALQTSASSFTTAGFNGSQKWFPKTGDTQTVTTGTPYTDYLWVDGTSYNFFAYANVPSGMTATITSSGVSLSGNVADAAAGQTDVLLGRFSGRGAGGKAFVNFYHPMTAVIFKVGTLDASITAVKSISIDGVYASGSTTLATGDGTPTFTWTPGSDVKTVSQAINSLPGEGALIGVPFVLIPQNLATKNVTVNMTVTMNGSDALLTTALNTGSWEAGKTYMYKVTYLNGQPNNQIWYESSSKQEFGFMPDAYTAEQIGAMFGATRYVSNEWSNGKGRLIFEGNITKIPSAGDHSTTTYHAFSRFNADKLFLPKSVEIIEGDYTEGPFLSSEISAIYFDYGTSFTFSYSGSSETAAFCGCSTPLSIIVGDSEPQVFTQNGDYLSPQLKYGVGLTKTATLWYMCFVKGTLITLADGSRKKVEDLTYDDELLVWNFDKGCLDSAKPLWLKKSEQSGYYYKVTLSDGTEIKLVGSDGNCHRLFNYTDKVFQYPTRMATGTKIYTENGIATLVSCERIEEETEFYNLITDKHINCFADGVLASCRYNNLYPIDEDMKFVKDGRKKRPYKEFKAAGISREWYNGLRLGEQTDSLADITEYINDRVAIEQPKPAPTFWQRIKTWWKSIFG